MKQSKNTTIIACSSALPGANLDGGSTLNDLSVAILRLSGSDAFRIAAELFTPREGQPALGAPGKKWLRIVGTVTWRGRTLRACAYRMPSPHSYTREDIVELHVPALRWVVGELLQRAIAAGANLAQPGEFTRRAYEHGRIGLQEAENISALIRASTADEARVYAARLSARPAAKLSGLRAELEELLSLVELGLDFSHEDVGVLTVDEMLARLKRLHASAKKLAGGADSSSSVSAELQSHAPHVALIGPVNAGKSSLFNALLGRDAAIVNAAAHTTRDVVAAPWLLDAGLCVLCDTAGLSGSAEKTEALEQSAQRLSAEHAARANLLLIVLAGNEPPDEAVVAELRRVVSANPQADVIRVWSKSDLAGSPDESKDFPAELAFGGAEPALRVSSRKGAGMAALRQALERAVSRVAAGHAQAWAGAAATGAHAARQAAAALERAHAGLAGGDGEDIVAVELREAIHAFWQAEGRLVRHDAVTETMLDKIFSAFCIGK